MVGGAHGVDGDVGEGTGVEALHLDVVAEGGEIAVESAELAARTVVVGVLRRRRLRRYRHLHRRTVGSGIRELGLHWANYAITVCIMVGARDKAVADCDLYLYLYIFSRKFIVMRTIIIISGQGFFSHLKCYASSVRYENKLYIRVIFVIKM